MSQGIPRQPVIIPSTLEIVLANPYNFHYIDWISWILQNTKKWMTNINLSFSVRKLNVNNKLL